MHPSVKRSLVLSVTLLCACGVEASDAQASFDESTQVASAVVAATGITSTASWALVVTGTPTWGNDATTPVLSVHVEVDDAVLRRSFPTFNGLERAFVLVPRGAGSDLQWERHDLAYRGASLRGYFGDVRVDVHELEPALLGVDVSALERNGVAIGLETNVGRIWAQAPGKNLPVTRAR